MKEATQTVRSPRRKKTENVPLSAFLLGIIILGGTFYIYDKDRIHEDEGSDTVKAGDIANMISVSLDTKEKPKIMQVTDTNKLGEANFFSGAKNGDVVFVYKDLKKVVLYDPTSGKVIKISDLN